MECGGPFVHISWKVHLPAFKMPICLCLKSVQMYDFILLTGNSCPLCEAVSQKLCSRGISCPPQLHRLQLGWQANQQTNCALLPAPNRRVCHTHCSRYKSSEHNSWIYSDYQFHCGSTHTFLYCAKWVSVWVPSIEASDHLLIEKIISLKIC